jgi:hypothetical protein
LSKRAAELGRLTGEARVCLFGVERNQTRLWSVAILPFLEFQHSLRSRTTIDWPSATITMGVRRIVVKGWPTVQRPATV